MVIWITGMSGAGKTTLALAILELLKPRLAQTVVLDGDIIRQCFGEDLDYREPSRRIQIGRIQRLARVLADQNLVVIVAALYAHPDLLRWNKENLRDYFEVYIEAPLELLMARDTNGLYAKAMRKEMPHVVGFDIPWYAPQQPNFVVNAQLGESPVAVAKRIVGAVPRLSAMLERA